MHVFDRETFFSALSLRQPTEYGGEFQPQKRQEIDKELCLQAGGRCANRSDEWSGEACGITWRHSKLFIGRSIASSSTLPCIQAGGVGFSVNRLKNASAPDNRGGTTSIISCLEQNLEVHLRCGGIQERSTKGTSSDVLLARPSIARLLFQIYQLYEIGSLSFVDSRIKIYLVCLIAFFRYPLPLNDRYFSQQQQQQMSTYEKRFSCNLKISSVYK